MEGLVAGLPALGRGRRELGGVARRTRQPSSGSEDAQRYGTAEES